MDWQVEASWKLESTCNSVWPGLTRSCVHWRWLATTCAHFGRDQICSQGDASFLLFVHSSKVGWLPFVHSCWSHRKARCLVMGFLCDLWGNLRVCLVTQRKSLLKFNLQHTWESVWPGLNDSNLLVFTDSEVRVETSVFFSKRNGIQNCALITRAVRTFHFVSKVVWVSSLVVSETSCNNF